jgi:hypothetical protein
MSVHAYRARDAVLFRARRRVSSARVVRTRCHAPFARIARCLHARLNRSLIITHVS